MRCSNQRDESAFDADQLESARQKGKKKEKFALVQEREKGEEKRERRRRGLRDLKDT